MTRKNRPLSQDCVTNQTVRSSSSELGKDGLFLWLGQLEGSEEVQQRHALLPVVSQFLPYHTSKGLPC